MNMKRIFLYTMLAAGLLASCTNDENLNGPVAAQITAGINQATTRVSVDGNSASFTNGDKINVVAPGNNTYVYTLQSDGTWSDGNNPYYFQDTNPVSFQAWYATATPQGATISIDTKTQTVTGGWNQWDILVTPTVTASASSPTINFTGDNAFQHIMSQVALIFKTGDGISDLTSLTAYALKSLVTNGTFNTQNCTLTNEATTGDVSISGISGVSGSEYSATPLILLPQAVTNKQIALEVTYNNQVYKANLSTPTGGLQEGYSYAYTVTIKNTGLEICMTNIQNWQSAEGYDQDVDAEL